MACHSGKLAWVLISLATTSLTQPGIAKSQIAGITSDGWHTWNVAAVANAPEMCCFKWRDGDVTRRRCDLDGDDGGFSNSNDGTQHSGTIQIYARIELGEIKHLRALSRNCPVTANSSIADLGPVTAANSIAWMRPLLSDHSGVSSDAIAAIAVHDGKRARDLLVETANSSENQDNREEAIFWMAQARIDETANVVKRFAFEDPHPDIRQHAAFAYSQSKANDITETLIRQGRNDIDAGVRSQAWFWLAETGAQESEREIRNALEYDKDERVREEAVFALAQLPEKRAVEALVEVLEDRQLSNEIREQALFWLAQTESDEALDYIDTILSNN